MSEQQAFQKEKRRLLIQFVSIIGICIALSILGHYWHLKLDVTDDHRFTLSKPTKKMLGTLKEEVNIKVLLKGNLPGNYEKLVLGTTDVLNSFASASNGKVKFIFENPVDGKSEDDKLKTAKELQAKGIVPMPIQTQMDEGEGMEKRFVWPYIVINANGKEMYFHLLENHLDMDMDGILNYSESMLEYKIASAIKTMNQADKINIAYVMGHGEILNFKTWDALYTLGEQYNLDTVDLNTGIEIPLAYQCIIISKPTLPFDEKSKFKLDQYVMRGGKILWFIDAINISLDTMAKTPSYTALPYELNLDDLFYKYGVRINNNLIEDLQCNKIPLTVGEVNGTPDIRKEPWLYFPLLTPISKHPIVNNMDAISCKFASSIDTIQNTGNTKHILLASSQYSRALGSPIDVSFNMIRYKPKTNLYNKKHLPIAVSIEGHFNSLYTNKMDPGFLSIYQDSLKKQFLTHTQKETKMIVVSDADIMQNDFSMKNGPSELGYYGPTGSFFANKPFLTNCIEYLTDENSLLEARSKDVQLRLLDKKKVKNNKIIMQLLNIALPIAIVLFFASAYFFFRKKKYENPLP